MTKVSVLVVASAFSMLPFATQAADDAKAQATLKKEGCLRCHSVSAQKDGPSYKSVAEKYKGKADAEATLTAHLTKSEKHAHIKSKDEGELKNLVQYILSR
jgi:cytochrome c